MQTWGSLTTLLHVTYEQVPKPQNSPLAFLECSNPPLSSEISVRLRLGVLLRLGVA